MFAVVNTIAARVASSSIRLFLYFSIFRIGTKDEKFGFESETLRPMKYKQIAELLNASFTFCFRCISGEQLQRRHITIMQAKQSISLEPGGQFELSGAPLETLHQTCAQVNLDFSSQVDMIRKFRAGLPLRPI
ncbi:hypothetical protein LOK49_LG01G00621 [Camellia lanceoleosa]|uniref:Uncharacterized protein n=1 Tax=Camellia lanceoleosa TaxID=1840588 RepID=A0ACC0J1F2_9ERIC|nr:hypothetical protein LOK49_LG01G00621 [Camellia lanceoleosa]